MLIKKTMKVIYAHQVLMKDRKYKSQIIKDYDGLWEGSEEELLEYQLARNIRYGYFEEAKSLLRLGVNPDAEVELGGKTTARKLAKFWNRTRDVFN